MTFVNAVLGALLAVGGVGLAAGAIFVFVTLMENLYNRIENNKWENKPKATVVVTAITLIVCCVIFGVVCQIVGRTPLGGRVRLDSKALRRFLLKRKRVDQGDDFNYKGDMTKSDYTWMSKSLEEDEIYVDRNQWYILIPEFLERVSFTAIMSPDYSKGTMKYEFRVERFPYLLEFLLSVVSEVQGMRFQDEDAINMSQNVVVMDLMISGKVLTKMNEKDRKITMGEIFDNFRDKEIYKLIRPHENVTMEELVVEKQMQELADA